MKIQTKSFYWKKAFKWERNSILFYFNEFLLGFDRMVFNLGENLIVDIEK